MVMKQTNQKPSTIPARWQWPIDVTSYDRSIILSNQERVAIERLMHRSVMDDIRWGKHTYQALERLARPLYDVCGLRNTPTNTRAKLTGRLCIEMYHRKKTFWGWSPDEWKEGVSHKSNRLRRLDLWDCGLTTLNMLLPDRFSMRSVGLSPSGIHRDFVPAGAKRAFRFRPMNCV